MGAGLVTVFGGSGFIGRSIVMRLAETGGRVRVATRRPNEAMVVRPMGDVGQIQTVQANVRNRRSVELAVRGADCVINLVGILHEKGAQKFADVHAEGAAHVAEAAAAAGVRTLIHMSALGARKDSPSLYARSKAEGEERVRAAFPDAVIMRPSVVFGPDDEFLNRFADLARFSPALPLVGGGHTRFQPVYVGDVAEAFIAALKDDAARGKTFELGGPRTYTLREIYECVMAETGRKRLLLPLPWGLASFMAAFLQLMPRPLLTPDQVRLLQADNVVTEGAADLRSLGITPTSLEAIAPTYLSRFARHLRQPEGNVA